MKDILIIIGIVVCIVFLNHIIFKPCRDFENKRCVGNGISQRQYQKYQCEENGGLSFSGGLLGSNSCTLLQTNQE